MSLVRRYPIGMIVMEDQGKRDEKIIAIPFEDPNYNTYTDAKDLPAHIFSEMRHFFQVYKNLEHKATVVNEVQGPEAAKEAIRTSFRQYLEME